MCGITGFYGNFNQSLLGKMKQAVLHRGPDASNELFFHVNGNVSIGLAHTRLSIIDLSSDGIQPMTVTCGCCQENRNDNNMKLWLIFNGEIYNHVELRKKLELDGHRFSSRTDSEVLLHLYRQHGHQMLNYLNGIFAFAIYDCISQEIFLARDHLGVKPLYYTQANNGFLFSSELKSLLQDVSISRELDATAVDAYLSHLWCPSPHTMLKVIKKLEPGFAMRVHNGKIKKQWQYYEIPMGIIKIPWDEKTIAKQLMQKVEHAVERQLISDVPIGAFLSGGLDSSAIVAMMRKIKPEQTIHCYTIQSKHSNKEGFSDDLPYAIKVAKHLGVELHRVQAESQMIQYLPEMLYYLDEPQADPAPINALLISKQAKLDGIKVLMSGAGGDDLFTGYRRHAALNMDKYWRWMPHSMRTALAKSARYVMDGGSVGVNNSFMRRMTKLFAYSDLNEDKYLASFFYWNTKKMRHGLYSKAFVSQLNQNDLPLLERSLLTQTENDRIHRMLYLELKHFLSDHNLNYTDRASMAMGIEVRVPLIDIELVDYAMRIPSCYKQKNNIGKAIFKKAMEPYLPKEIIYRSKTGFGAPLRQWLQNDLCDLINDCLSKKSIVNRGLFDYENINRLIQLNSKGKIDGTYTIFSLLCMEIWCRQFIDSETPIILK